jgi:hypothetical protein
MWGGVYAGDGGLRASRRVEFSLLSMAFTRRMVQYDIATSQSRERKVQMARKASTCKTRKYQTFALILYYYCILSLLSINLTSWLPKAKNFCK